MHNVKHSMYATELQIVSAVSSACRANAARAARAVGDYIVTFDSRFTPGAGLYLAVVTNRDRKVVGTAVVDPFDV